MEMQEQLARIRELSSIIHDSRNVYGLVYDCTWSKYPSGSAIIRREPIYASRERRHAKRELNRIRKHSLDEELRMLAKQELKRPNDFTPRESMHRNYEDFAKSHPVLDLAGFIVFSWVCIAAGGAAIYSAARLYNFLSK